MQDPKSKTWYSTWAEAEPDVASKNLKITPSMFPPGCSIGEDDSAVEAMHLDRAMRFLPHDQDTGGFFVAVLEKVAECADMTVQKGFQKKRKAAGDAQVRYAQCLLSIAALLTRPFLGVSVAS